MKFVKKGCFGYIKSQRLLELLKTLLFLGTAIALYRIGISATGSNKNLMTLFAVLGCLPMAKFFVNFIMFSKAKGCSLELKNKLDEKGISPLFYDLYFTSFKKNFQISAVFYKKKNLLLISEDSTISVEEAEEHVKTILTNCGYADVLVKVYTDSDKYIARLCELEGLEADKKDLSFLCDNLLGVSL